MRSFEHYARHPGAVADAERALLAWRQEVVRQQLRGQHGDGSSAALKLAEREIAAANDFLAPPRIAAKASTLSQAIEHLLESQSSADQFQDCLPGDDPAAKTARLLIWHAPGAARMLAGDRARRLRLNAGTPAGAAALRAAIDYGRDLLAASAAATSPR